MSQTIEVKVPDIGDFKDVPVIEILVKAGDVIKVDDALVTLESEKATIDVPAPAAGMVKEVKLKVGDKVAQGSLVLLLEAVGAAPAKAAPAAAPAPVAVTPSGGVIEVKVPDIGDFKDVPVIEVMVKAGDVIKAEDSLVTLESEKATIDVPSPAAGVVKELKLKVGDKVAQGSVVLLLEASGVAAAPKAAAPAPAKAVAPTVAAPAAAPARSASAATGAAPAPTSDEPTVAPEMIVMPTPAELVAQVVSGRLSHASPSVRHYARELGVDVARVKGSGPKGRILKEDVQAFVKGVMAGAVAAAPAPSGGGLDLLPWPKIDFRKFGPTDIKPLSRIKKLSGANLARNWVMIPHVTQFDEADITELEQFRVSINKEHEKSGVKVTILAFLIKAAVAALKKFPEFNSSLDGDNLVLKQYFHIGFAADTPNGLVVPVIKDADKKSVLEIATETSELAKKARDGKLGPTDMQGGCFSISSLGGIGGTLFTPIINAPEVAILGVSKSEIKPKWNGKEFAPRLMLPLSLSYDHRVIDGASGARFITHVGQVLADMRRAML
jgi:pyruvate dehydrogenase E2 component (dihydrolipoamide acetyltransferase)